MTVGNPSIGNSGFVTAQAIRSSKNVIIICITSILLNAPSLVFTVLRNVTEVRSDSFSFISVWLFECNTFVNSMVYLFLYRSLRNILGCMFRTILSNVYDRYN